jgi:membrane protein
MENSSASDAVGARASAELRRDPTEETGGGEKPSLFPALKLAFKNFREHNMTDRGGGLTYFLVMSLFPALLVGVSLLGLFGQQTIVTDATKYLQDAGAPDDVLNIVNSSLDSIVSSSNSKALLPAGDRPAARAQRRLGRLRRGRPGAQRCIR